MTIYIMDGMCFVAVDLGRSSYMLCIGSKEEVDKATTQEGLDMVKRAFAINRFRNANSDQLSHQ